MKRFLFVALSLLSACADPNAEGAAAAEAEERRLPSKLTDVDISSRAAEVLGAVEACLSHEDAWTNAVKSHGAYADASLAQVGPECAGGWDSNCTAAWDRNQARVEASLARVDDIIRPARSQMQRLCPEAGALALRYAAELEQARPSSSLAAPLRECAEGANKLGEYAIINGSVPSKAADLRQFNEDLKRMVRLGHEGEEKARLCVQTLGAEMSARGSAKPKATPEPQQPPSYDESWGGAEIKTATNGPQGFESRGKCRLKVSGRAIINGSCYFNLDPDGSFQIMSLRQDYFAYVALDGEGVAQGYWNGRAGGSHAHAPLGLLRRKGACWSNQAAEVCAWS